MEKIMFLLAPLFFIAFWLFVFFLISRFGWARLAEKYRYDGQFFGTKIGLISATINWADYNNALILQINDKGMLIKPLKIFGFFHPPLLIPWREIKSVQERKILFVRYWELDIGQPKVARIRLKDRVFQEIEHKINR